MRIWKVLPLAVTIFFTGYAFSDASQLNSSTKTNVALLQYKKIAVIKFTIPKNEASGQEAADILALGFLKQGYNVVGSSEIVSLIDQNEVNSSGLTPQIKAKLKSSGIDSVITGTINEYFCSGSESILQSLKDGGKNHCAVTVTARMLDLDSGEIVWGATGSDAQDGKWITADSVLRSIMLKLQETIPNISQLRESISSAGGKSQAPQPPAQRSAR